SRRGFLQLTSTLGVAAGLAAALSACGGSGSASSGASSAATEEQSSSAQANPDGVIKAGISYELGTNGYDPATTPAALTVSANWHT
ncbi:ABC superfamily ATP binding cassette transporter, binding protein, partial [human gut metagenome]